MKTIIKHPLPVRNIDSSSLEELNEIIITCVYSQSLSDLKINMKPFQYSVKFGYGFGKNHMWVKERYSHSPSTLKEETLLLIEEE